MRDKKVTQKKIFLKTFGCQMNDRDSEHVVAQFLANGYTLVDSKQDADVILLNTCSVRQHAEHKVWSALGHLKRLKKKRKEIIVGVLGCMAENIKDAIIERAPYVDLICGPNDLMNVSKLVTKIQRNRKNILAVGLPHRDKSFYRHLYQPHARHSYVVTMEGCDNYCSYCIVPYVRGRERSRSYRDIISEVKQLAKKKISSVTLLGQNVNSYRGGCSFAELLKKMNEIDGIAEISFATSHPKDASRALFKAMRDCTKIKKYLHLPIQTGSNRILRLMNRGYTREHYGELVDAYRAIVGNKARLGTDVIVGFPTEKDKDFKDTVNAIKMIKFNSAYIFKYSSRSRTKAAQLPDDVPDETKKKRHKVLLDLQRKISKNVRSTLRRTPA